MSRPSNTDIMQWDVRTWARAIPFWESYCRFATGQTALELGGREGGLSLYLASKGLDVICSDIEDVKPKAGPLHRSFGVENHIEYDIIDATQIPFENHFDFISFKSIIGGIGRNGHSELQRLTFDSIFRALKPGGTLIFAENLVGSPLHVFLRKKFVRWGNEWNYVNKNDLLSFLAPFENIQIQTTGCLSAFGRSEFQRNFLSYADSLAFNFICPDRWHYVSFGVATKPIQGTS